MASMMGKRLSGKTILVTGASSGIGKSCAEEFARTSPESLRLILTARRIDALESIASDINKTISAKVKIHCVQLDISKTNNISAFISELPAEFKDIDVLVNNAGMVRGVAQAPDIDPKDIDLMFATNVTGLIAMTQAILPIMKKKGDSGAGDIINIGSIAGREGYPGGSIYCATKAAVRTFTDALRRELIATRIRVIEVDPGQVETVSFLLSWSMLYFQTLVKQIGKDWIEPKLTTDQMHQEFSLVRFDGDKEKALNVYKGVTPLMPDDIAEIIVFIAGRPENVVLADSLIFPNHQVRH